MLLLSPWGPQGAWVYYYQPYRQLLLEIITIQEPPVSLNCAIRCRDTTGYMDDTSSTAGIECGGEGGEYLRQSMTILTRMRVRPGAAPHSCNATG